MSAALSDRDARICDHADWAGELLDVVDAVIARLRRTSTGIAEADVQQARVLAHFLAMRPDVDGWHDRLGVDVRRIAAAAEAERDPYRARAVA